MAEKKDDDKTAPSTTGPASAASTPAVGPDAATLAMIERMAQEMADRRRPRRPPEPDVRTAENLPPPAHLDPAFIRPGERFPPVEIGAAPIAEPKTEPQRAIEHELEAEFESTIARASQVAPEPETKTAPVIEPAAEPAIEPKVEPKIESGLETKTATKFEPEIERRAEPKIPPSIEPKSAPAPRPLFDDHFRLAFTRSQSAGIAVAIFAFAMSACGMAAYSWMTAHDWSCRSGLMTKYCPQLAPASKPLTRPEIPI